MTLLKLLALIRISGTRKTDLGRSRLASSSHDNCIPESLWARSCLWALPEAAQPKKELVRNAPEGCHPERDASPSEDPDVVQSSLPSFHRKEKPPRGLCLHSMLSSPQAGVVHTPVGWARGGCNTEQQAAGLSSNFLFCTVLARWHACVCVCVCGVRL